MKRAKEKSNASATAQNGSSALEAPHLATDLLKRLELVGEPQLPAFKTKVGLIAQGLGKSALALTIDDVFDVKPRLRKFLENRRLAENTVQAYVFEVAKMLRLAEEMGWSPYAQVPEAWLDVFSASKAANCLSVCGFAMKHRRTPSQFTEGDLDLWILQRIDARTWETAVKEARRFVKLMSQRGLWSKLTARQKEDYGVRFEDFPDGLRAEVSSVLKWKTAAVAKGRGKNGKIRELTAGNVRSAICSVLGYAKNICGLNFYSLAELITEDLIYEYVSWSLHDRGLCGNTVHLRLVSIHALFRQHPDLKQHDVSWLEDLANNVPRESETEAQEKRAAKQVPYDRARDIAKLVHLERKVAAKKSTRRLANVVQRELLMSWLTILPWRQRNLREARLTGPRPNVFKAPVRQAHGMAKPAWVEEMLLKNPDEEFWQFKFAPEETKNGRGVHGLIPKQLIPLLEEFIAEHRPHLLGDRSTETLLLNNSGGPLTPNRLANIVGELSLRYARKRVTPHTFRHIVAYAWLESSAKDYLTLSKILWHANVNTTLKIYGSTFNESNGACAMERWLEKR